MVYETGDRVVIDQGSNLGELVVVMTVNGERVKVAHLNRYEVATYDAFNLEPCPGPTDEKLDFDTVELLGLDGTNRDCNPFFPFTYGNVKQGITWVRENGWNV